MADKQTIQDFRDKCFVLTKPESVSALLDKANRQALINDIIELEPKVTDVSLSGKLQHFRSNLVRLDTANNIDDVTPLLNRISTYAFEVFYHDGLRNMAREETSSAQVSLQKQIEAFESFEPGEEYGFPDEGNEPDLDSKP